MTTLLILIVLFVVSAVAINFWQKTKMKKDYKPLNLEDLIEK